MLIANLSARRRVPLRWAAALSSGFVVLAMIATWTLRPEALAQGSEESYPGSKSAPFTADAPLYYVQSDGGSITYMLTVLNDSPWSIVVTRAEVDPSSAQGVFATSSIRLPANREVAPGAEIALHARATFAPCRFDSAASTNPDSAMNVPGFRVTFRQFGIERTQLITPREHHAAVHPC
jgi:hypothetical protein